MTNGIILAAGLGSRLQPLTNKIPKPMLSINNEPMIERQIRFLKKKEIEDIYIVTGYKHEAFEYLKEKFNVNLIFNKQYSRYNNIFSLYLVRDKVADSFIIEGDVFIEKNIFDIPKRSVYYTRKSETNKEEWVVENDEENRITSLKVMSSFSKYVLAGVSYWDQKEGERLQGKLSELNFDNLDTTLLWDEIVKKHIYEFEVYNIRMDENIYEIDDQDDYYNLLEKLKG